MRRVRLWRRAGRSELPTVTSFVILVKRNEIFVSTGRSWKEPALAISGCKCQVCVRTAFIQDPVAPIHLSETRRPLASSDARREQAAQAARSASFFLSMCVRKRYVLWRKNIRAPSRQLRYVFCTQRACLWTQDFVK